MSPVHSGVANSHRSRRRWYKEFELWTYRILTIQFSIAVVLLSSAVLIAVRTPSEQQRYGERVLAALGRVERGIQDIEEVQKGIATDISGIGKDTGEILEGMATKQDVEEIKQLLAKSKQASVEDAETAGPPALELTPEMRERVEAVLADENAEAKDRARAAIAAGDFEAADGFLAEAMKPVLGEAFEWLTIEGDRYYYAGEYDKAVEPYEKAMGLRAGDFTARSNAAIAHTFAGLGDIAGHRRRAIEIMEGTLARVPAGTIDWAMTQNNLGIAWGNMPMGDRGENLRRAIEAFEKALTVYTKQAHPVDWAGTQNNLGNAWQNMPTGDAGENLRRAIEAYEQALTVRTKQAHPVDWAGTQNNLGTAWAQMPTGERGENLRRAIEAYESALTVHTKQAHPVEWARTQNNLGTAWRNMQTGNKGENLRRAIEAFEKALTVRTKQAYPVEWAGTQNNLGAAWGEMPTGERGENLRQAIEAFEKALTVYTKQSHPVDWAGTHYNMAFALAELSELPGQRRSELLRRAIGSGKAALMVWTAKAFPQWHVMAMENLEILRGMYEQAGGEGEVGFEGIEAGE